MLYHYTDKLKTAKKSRREIFYFGSIVEKEIFNNCAIIDAGNKSKEEEIDDVLGFFGDSDSDDDETGGVKGIISKAGRFSLNMSAVLELAYEKIKKCSSGYSVEATSASLAVIKL